MRILWLSFVDAEHNAPYFGRLSEFRCAALAIDRCIEAEARHYDAFIMGHFQDPGLYEARSAVRIPVVGTGEATLHLAAQLGRRIGLVSIDPIFAVWHHEQAERYGLANRVVAIAGLGAT